MLTKVVGIGASAGGLEALQKLFATIHNNTNMAFVIVQHLSPHFKSLMDELLQKHTKIPILEIEDQVEIKRNTIYLIPPNKNIKIENNKIRTFDREESGKLNLPIDIFFHSLGENYKHKSIGIILSGTGTDGSRGLKTIKEEGGTVIIEDPVFAKFDGMPNASIQLGIEDAILSPYEIGKLINSISQTNSLVQFSSQAQIDKRLLEQVNRILEKLREKAKIDFLQYRLPTIIRRIENRMQINKIVLMEHYHDFLVQNNEEIDSLANDILIGVTQFFRDKSAFELLEKKVLNNLFPTDKEDEPLRIWCMACSTGEEAYSLAYLLVNIKEKINSKRKISIFASDLDQRSIQKATLGIYDERDVNNLPDQIKEEMFTKKGFSHQIKKKYREAILFVHHDVLNDPPFIKLDLVTCRNFLIYIQPQFQNDLIRSFLFSLNTNAFLFLGMSESLGHYRDSFTEIGEKKNIYKKVKETKSFLLHERKSPIVTHSHTSHTQINSMKSNLENIASKPISYVQHEYTDLLVRDFAPTCVFINEQFDVLYMNGEIDSLLSFPQRSGDSLNLLNMTDSESSLVFRNGMRKVEAENETILYNNIQFKKKENLFNIDIRFTPYLLDTEGRKMILIEFLSITNSKDRTKDSSFTEEDYVKDRLKTLELELKNLKKLNRDLIEQNETNNEELQAANEELLASNEELQSTNEELQSVNEELFSVNTELQEKIGELKIAHGDISNLLEATDIGTIFLDNDLNIRRYTPSLKVHFNLTNQDIGRNIVNFSSNLIDANITESCFRVLKTGVSQEKEIDNINGKTYLKKIKPYKTNTQQSDGLLISFIDITELRQAQETIAESEERFQLAIEGTNEGIWDWIDVNGMEEWWSPQFYRLLGYTPEELPANLNSFFSILHPDDQKHTELAINNHLKRDIPFDVKYRLKTKEKGYQWFRAKAYLIRNSQGIPTRMVGSITDIQGEMAILVKLRDKEEILNAIIEGTMAGYWDWNIPANIEYMSDGFKDMFGYKPHEIENTPDWWQANIHPDDLAPVFDVFNKHVESKGKVDYNNIVRYFHKNGSIVWVFCRGKVIEWAENGEPIRMVGSHVDVTNLMKAEQEVKSRSEQLEKSNKELEQFAYIATHDLRAPVLNLMALINIFKDANLVNEENEDLINKFDSTVNVFNDTLHDLIDITNLRKKTEESIQDVIIKEIIKDQADIINEQYSCFPVLTLDLKVNAVNYLQGHINSIFYNLYSNAVKYRSKDRDLEIKISTYKKDGFCVIEIQDNGTGFEMSQVDKVFGMFQRLNESVDGKGVGMYVIKSLIESNHGKIDVLSEVNMGTTFTIYLKEME